jgi:fatty aldehyde-generating acyl-ACP reductase
MGYQSSDIDFALIGHQDCWKNITGFVDLLSNNGRSLPVEKISEVYSFIPPRKLFDIEIRSITGETVRGGYIETFISPDELATRYWKKNVMKVNEAAECVRKLNAGVAALGGFTSIVIEGRNDRLNENSSTNFTTGNTLTSAFIVKSLEKACIKLGKNLGNQQLLIIGATGDIGSACVQYFSGKVKKLLLCAREGSKLIALERKLKEKGYEAHASRYITTLLPHADLIISIASSTIQHFHSSLCKKDVIICDAGYPKNLVSNMNESLKARSYSGGMGLVTGGYQLIPAAHHNFYEFPVKDVVHGCLLEAVVLAFEKMFTPFSAGRGNISTDKIELIYSLAQKHGITEAPFFNSITAW